MDEITKMKKNVENLEQQQLINRILARPNQELEATIEAAKQAQANKDRNRTTATKNVEVAAIKQRSKEILQAKIQEQEKMDKEAIQKERLKVVDKEYKQLQEEEIRRNIQRQKQVDEILKQLNYKTDHKKYKSKTSQELLRKNLENARKKQNLINKKKEYLLSQWRQIQKNEALKQIEELRQVENKKIQKTKQTIPIQQTQTIIPKEIQHNVTQQAVEQKPKAFVQRILKKAINTYEKNIHFYNQDYNNKAKIEQLVRNRQIAQPKGPINKNHLFEATIGETIKIVSPEQTSKQEENSFKNKRTSFIARLKQKVDEKKAKQEADKQPQPKYRPRTL